MNGYLRARDRRNPENRNTPCRSWQLVAEAGRDDRNRRKQIFKSFNGSEAQARTALRRLLHDLEAGKEATDPNIRLSDWIDRWLAHKAVQKRKARTINSYRDLLRLHVAPVLGHLRLADLKTLAIQKHFDKLYQSGRRTKAHKGEALSPATMRRIHQAFSAAIDFAIKMNVMAVNPIKAIELPRGERRSYRVLNHGEAQALLSAARGTYLYLFILIGYCIGLRRGEIFGLRWSDINWATSTLLVSRQLSRGGTVETPKSRSSIREIMIPEVLLLDLKRHLAEQSSLKELIGTDYTNIDYIFANEVGAPYLPDSMYSLYRSIVKRSGVLYLRPHDLRHSSASLLLAAGIPVAEVAAILGHSNPGVTMSIYAHALNTTSSEAARAIDDRFVEFSNNA